MVKIDNYSSRSWVAFETSVLAQQNFDSVAIPFSGSAKLDWHLKIWNKRVWSNDICQWAWQVARARVENNREQLCDYDLGIILNDAEAERGPLNNASLRRWFGEQDARWLDNVRSNIAGLGSDAQKALALLAGVLTGEYILSFDAATAPLRRPLAEIYTEQIAYVNRIVDNQVMNRAANFEALEFIIRTKADLLYANLPRPGALVDFLQSPRCWREAWVRGHDDYQEALLPALKGSFGGNVMSKERYLKLLAELLERAKHLPAWAIGFQQGHPASLTEMVNEVKRQRPVKATYAKDMSDIIGGGHAYIVLAYK